MVKMFWISVLIVLVAMGGLYFAFDKSPQLSSGSALACTNRYDTEIACNNRNVCKLNGATADYAPLNFDGSCPTGFSIYLITTGNMDGLCTIAKAMSNHNTATAPPACASGCFDRGVSPYEDRSVNLCCTAGTERICTDAPKPIEAPTTRPK